jgi:ISXO2-like transposase domain/Transposase zinc-ribbon domain
MNTTKQMTMRELLERFPDEKACRAFLATKRWPDGVVKCPRCGEKAYTLKARPFHYLCKSGKQSAEPETGKVVTCDKKNGYRFSVITRTVFENTNYPVREWFRVAFLMLSSKKGMSAHQIYRMLGMGSYETAWFMCHRIRAAMRGDVIPPLGSDGGEVEVDETYIGGRNKFRHADKKHGPSAYGGHDKVPVIGAIARKGNVICKALEEVGFTTYEDFVRQAVSSKVRLLATDEHMGYRHLRKRGYQHRTVNHGEKQYVTGTVHTNTIESFWSLLKRGIVGSYHHVTREYLPLYLNEFSFRFNNRNNPDIFDAIIGGC